MRGSKTLADVSEKGLPPPLNLRLMWLGKYYNDVHDTLTRFFPLRLCNLKTHIGGRCRAKTKRKKKGKHSLKDGRCLFLALYVRGYVGRGKNQTNVVCVEAWGCCRLFVSREPATQSLLAGHLPSSFFPDSFFLLSFFSSPFNHDSQLAAGAVISPGAAARASEGRRGSLFFAYVCNGSRHMLGPWESGPPRFHSSGKKSPNWSKPWGGGGRATADESTLLNITCIHPARIHTYTVHSTELL